MSQATTESPIKRFSNSKTQRVWTRQLITSRSDFHFKVIVRSDRAHAWRNHFDSDSIAYRAMSRWEHLAAKNHGFVHEGTGSTAEKSAHYRQEDAPTRRTIQLLKKFCRAKGIISDDCWGTNQWGHRVIGFWLVNHREFCEEKNHQHRYWRPINDAVRRARFHPYEIAPDSQPIRDGFAANAQPIRGDFAPISPKSNFGFAPSPSFGFALPSSQNPAKQEDTQNSPCVGISENGDLVGGSVCSEVSVRNELNPLSILNPLNSEDKANGNINTNVNRNTNGDGKSQNTKIDSLSDLTSREATPAGMDDLTKIFTEKLRAVGSIAGGSLEAVLDAISDGEFETGALQSYSGTNSLESACRKAVEKFQDVPLSDRSVLARVLSEVMNNLERDGLQWPPGFKPVITRLREGGPLQQASASSEANVFKADSPLSWPDWVEDLRPHRDLLQAATKAYGLPNTFAAAADFLRKVLTALERNGVAVPEGLQRAEETLRAR